MADVIRVIQDDLTFYTRTWQDDMTLSTRVYQDDLTFYTRTWQDDMTLSTRVYQDDITLSTRVWMDDFYMGGIGYTSGILTDPFGFNLQSETGENILAG
jgi:hypothetical protein